MKGKKIDHRSDPRMNSSSELCKFLTLAPAPQGQHLVAATRNGGARRCWANLDVPLPVLVSEDM